MTGCHVLCMTEWDFGKWHNVLPQEWQRLLLFPHCSGRDPGFSLRETLGCFNSYNFLRHTFQSETAREKKKSFADTFLKCQPRTRWHTALYLILIHSVHTLAFCWADTEGRSKSEGGEGGGGKPVSSMRKCLSHSTLRSSLSAHAQPQEGMGSMVLMMTARIVGYADHRRKPFCWVLIPSGSFTFWRIEKNALKIKIISLIWLHPRFMAAAFKGNWENQLRNSHLYHFLSFNIL